MGEIIAAVRASDVLGPAPGAERAECSVCTAEVLLSPSSLAVKETNLGALIVCNRCLPEVAQEAELTVGKSPLAEAELERLIKTTPEDRRCEHGFAWCPACHGFSKNTGANETPADFPAPEEE